MSKSQKAPPAPDPVATAQAQGAANKEAVLESAKVNQIGEQTPYGNVKWTGEVGGADRTRVTELAPAQQRQLDMQNQLADTLGGLAITKSGQVPSTPFSLDGLPALPGMDDFSAERSRVEDATYNRSMRLLEPQYEKQDRQMQTMLANQGLPVGSEAYNDATTNFAQKRDLAYQDAADRAVLAGGGEQSRMFGLGLTGRQQGLNERLTSRTQDINELAAILQGSPALSGPGAGPTAQYQVAPSDPLGAAQMGYQGQLAGYQGAVSQQNANMGGLAGLGAAAMMAFGCSKTFKDPIGPVSTLEGVEALPIERWTYKPGFEDGKEHIGPYAEDFARIFGVGDGRIISGIDAVGVCLQAIRELSAKVRKLEAER
jgi:hypothetical protein